MFYVLCVYNSFHLLSIMCSALKIDFLCVINYVYMLFVYNSFLCYTLCGMCYVFTIHFYVLSIMY